MDFPDLQPGLNAEVTAVVDDSLVVKHTGGDGVFSTPSMISLMERAGMQAVQPVLGEGYTTVGFEVNVKHFAATPKGKSVTVRAELLEVDRQAPQPTTSDHARLLVQLRSRRISERCLSLCRRGVKRLRVVQTMSPGKLLGPRY